MKLITGGILLFIKIQFFPNVQLLLWMTVAIALDFVTGIIKAKTIGEKRTSAGYRKTVVKFIQYAGAILAGLVLQHVGSHNDTAKFLFSYVNDGLIIFITYIEVTSIFENLYAIDKSTWISKFFYAPVLKILTFQLKNNPVIKKADAITNSENTN